MATKGKRLTLLVAWVGVALVVVIAGIYRDDIVVWYRLTRDFERLPQNEQGYPEYRHRQTGIVMVRVPGGKFLMGSDRREEEKPVHKATLLPFRDHASDDLAERSRPRRRHEEELRLPRRGHGSKAPSEEYPDGAGSAKRPADLTLPETSPILLREAWTHRDEG